MTQRKREKQRKLTAQGFLPVRKIEHGVIETTDGRYLKILEIETINFMLRSDEEQCHIISTFASWLKISPMRLQFKSITRKADSDRHVAMVRRGDSEDVGQVCSALQTAEQNARAYFLQCGNSIVQPADPDEATAEILYMFFNRQSCVDEPFSERVNRVVLDIMAARGKVIGIDPVPKINVAHFLAPRGIDLTYLNYTVMDGLYYAFLYIRGNGYPGIVRAGWISSLINAGEGIDVDVHLRRGNRSRTIDKVAQRIRLNRTKLRSMQDTSTDYEELTNSIQAGYFIKQGIANNNEDLFYMSVFITVSARTYEENAYPG